MTKEKALNDLYTNIIEALSKEDLSENPILIIPIMDFFITQLCLISYQQDDNNYSIGGIVNAEQTRIEIVGPEVLQLLGNDKSDSQILRLFRFRRDKKI